MDMRSRWINDGPDTFELEAVLASGLHDGIHEDQLEEMGLKGKAARAAGAAMPAQSTTFATAPVVQRTGAVQASAAPHRNADWFSQNYPKLQPADLADYYREKYLKVHVPVRTGTHDGFQKLRALLAEHVHNSNVLEEPTTNRPLGSSNLGSSEDADLTARQSDVTRYVPNHFMDASPGMPRVSHVVMMTLAALVVGGLVGLGIAKPEGLGSLLRLQATSAQIQALVPATFWQ